MAFLVRSIGFFRCMFCHIHCACTGGSSSVPVDHRHIVFVSFMIVMISIGLAFLVEIYLSINQSIFSAVRDDKLP
jgi:hypothetical protein